MEETYDKYIENVLALPDALLVGGLKGAFPSEKEVFRFCTEQNITLQIRDKRQAAAAISHAGISYAEIKDAFGMYLGLQDSYFCKKYKVPKETLDELGRRELVPVMAEYGAEKLYDAEFYYDAVKFSTAVNILRRL